MKETIGGFAALWTAWPPWKAARPMRVLVLPRYERLGASSRVRMYQYMPYLAQHGSRRTPRHFFRITI